MRTAHRSKDIEMVAPTSGKSKTFTMKVPRALYRQIEMVAELRGVSVAAVFLEPWTITPPRRGRPSKGPPG